MTHQLSKQIASRIRELFLNGKWIANTNYREQISDLDWQTAVKSTMNLNSVAKLSFHINYYLEGLIKVFNGGPLEISDKYSFDLPEIPSQDAWEELVKRFMSNAEIFASQVDNLSDDTLENAFVKPQYGTVYRNIEAVLEHAYYHLGQLVLIKKLILAGH